MEPHVTAEQKCNKEPREKNLLQRKWVSEPSSGSKRSTYTEGFSGTSIPGSGKPLLSAVSQPSSESQFFPRSYSYQLPHSYSQQPMQKPFPTGTKPQPGMEPHAWPFPGQLQSLPTDDMFSVHSRSHGAFPHQKSPSLPSTFGQYSLSGSDQKEDGHKKEQKPKKPGKYICQYCGRACAKPSVLKKHIRSHTGERPYPCEPCGFSFKTKSNLYKHRKSHAHAIKAGLIPFSELATRTDIDQASSVGEAELHSDGDQSTDTDEETADVGLYPEKSSSVPQISFESDKSTLEKGREPAYADSAEEMAMASMKVPILIVPKPGLPSTAIECMPFTDIKASHIGGQMVQGDESQTIRQRLALRLTDKKSQDTEQSLNLLSPHSKGSTDSGYFSRSESAEQQISPPNTNAKSYEEIMFGRSWYYRPNSRSRLPLTVGMAAMVGPNAQNRSAMAEMDMGKISEDPMFFKGNCAESQMVQGCDPNQFPRGSLLEAPSDSGPLIRSNSMPTPSPTNLNVPSTLRGSHSFDEMMSPDDVFYPGVPGLRRLRRQAAFEHGESENYGRIAGPFPTMKVGERGHLLPECKGSGSELACPELRAAHGAGGAKMGMPEVTTRKRRKEKSVGDEEDCPGQYEDAQSGSLEKPGDYEFKHGGLETTRATPTGRGSMYIGLSSYEGFDKATGMCPDSVQEPDRKAINVISVIQHTNLLSRPSSFEKSDSTDHQSYQSENLTSQHSEHSDAENTDDVRSPESILRSESMTHQQQNDRELASLSPSQQYHMPHKLVRQPNIQVPEIRVTEEPDKPEKEPELPVKEPEKHVEEFQWPQRSETLSQLPAEKLPPKKKRLRLADLEHSSGESSFESTCTSLSRSPSQESNLSHSSSLSMSFDREESLKSMSPTKHDDFSKQSEFLTVPGSGHSLSIPGHHLKEMRRSSSEQAPCALPTEVPETRSKSFDYGSLSGASRQGEVYASASSMKERRRGYLVRQASLSVYPEVVLQEQGSELNIKQEFSDPHATPSAWQSTPSLTGSSLSAINELIRHKRGSYHLLQQSISEDSQSEDLQKSPRLPGQLSSDSEASIHEHQDIMHHSTQQSSLASSAFTPLPSMVWYPELPRHSPGFHQLQKLHIRPSMLQKSQPHQGQNNSKTNGAGTGYPYSSRGTPGTCSSKVLNSNSVYLQQVQPVFATQNIVSQPSLPGMLVPVRIQTHVPSYGSVMYTSVSQMIPASAQSTNSIRLLCPDNATASSIINKTSKVPLGLSLSKILGQPEGLLQYPLLKLSEPSPGRLNTGIPLSLTSGTISTTDASSSMGGSKRMLSPASSLELFIGTKQQKRVKEEKMYGQIVKELSAVELSNSGTPSDSDASPQPDVLKTGDSTEDQERMSSSPPANYLSSMFSARPTGSHVPDVPLTDSFTPPLQIVPNSFKKTESPEELDIDKSTPEESSSPQSMNSSDVQDNSNTSLSSKVPVNMLVQLGASQGGTVSESTLLLTDLADVEQFFQFPSLRTTTSVSWCYLNYTKPNFAQTTPLLSVYGSWSVSSYNPNPLNLSTKAVLALLRSKQRVNTETYTMALMYQPGTGKLVSSLMWKQKFERTKSEVMQLDVGKFGKKMKGVNSRDRGKEDHGETDVSPKQAEPTRIKIFEGGYKSNEDYVYVRGRGRGKYICEECGIRCKKPSMLKKHIRTHTDVRPYVCKFCNFAFKTKGNLTKHMKSKAHMKKCLELGVSVTCVDDAESEEAGAAVENRRDLIKILSEHQFSDADDSEGIDEDGDEVDEDEEDDDDYDGDSTPKTHSRSTSPHPYIVPSHSITSIATSQEIAPELPDSISKQLLMPYNGLPSIQITKLMVPTERSKEGQRKGYQQHLQSVLGEEGRRRLEKPSSMDEDLGLSPVHSPHDFSPSPGLYLPGCDSPLREPSPTSRRYLSPRRDLSPRGRLSPRREMSPLRPLSPRREMYRRELSPRRDLPGRRELSPRGRPRGIIRPVSPRRPSYLGPWTQYSLSEMSADKRKGHTDLEKDLRKCRYGDIHGSEASSPGLFSHLPLHSQQLNHTPFPMIPVGGIQMVPGCAHPTWPPSKVSHSKASSHHSEASKDAEELKQSQETTVSPKAACSSPVSTEEVSEKKDESVQTCTKAIACLCIASEEPTKKLEQLHQHSPSPSPAVPDPSAPSSIQHFSSSEVVQPLHSGTESGTAVASKALMGTRPPPYGTEGARQSTGLRGSGEESSGAKSKESIKDTINR